MTDNKTPETKQNENLEQEQLEQNAQDQQEQVEAQETEQTSETEQAQDQEAELSPQEKLLAKIRKLSTSVPLSAEDYVNLECVDVLEDLKKSLAQAQKEDLVDRELLTEVWNNLRPFLTSLKQENFTYLRDPDYSTKIHNTLNYHKAEVDSAKSALHRAKRDAQKSAAFANEKVVKTIVKPLIQNLVTAREHLPKDSTNPEFANFVAQLEKFDTDFRETLAEHNIFVFGKVGDDFDPSAHDAISAMPTDDFANHMKVAVVTAEGYKLNDRVVVPAQVIIYMFATS